MTARRAFALPDALATTVATAALLCILLIRAPHTRHLSAQSESLANLRQLSTGNASYAADYQDRFATFSWTHTAPVPTTHDDLRASAAIGPIAASAAQAVDILRRRSGHPEIPVIDNWLPGFRFSHLVLADYLDLPVPLPVAVSPEDPYRRRWSENPDAYFANQLPPQPGTDDTEYWRGPFRSSYEMPPAFFSPDAVTTTTGAIIDGGSFNIFQLLSAIGSNQQQTLGGRRTTEVQFPANKVFMYDFAQWQGARTPVFFMYDHARIPMVMADGSAAVRVTSQANNGFQPQNPTSPFYTQTSYGSYLWEPPVVGNVTNVRCRYRFTRWGLRGRDFEGQEVPAP